MTASGGRIAAAVTAWASRCNGHDLVAGAAQARRERPQDVRLVVDDENARPSRECHVTVAGRGQCEHERRTRTELGLLQPDGTPFACANPRAIASPRPLPCGPSVPRSNGSKILSRWGPVTPGP